MTSPDEMQYLIDRCTFQSVKAVLFSKTDIDTVVLVKPNCSLEQVATFCVNNDASALERLKVKTDIVFLSPTKHPRTPVDRHSYLLDSDFVEVLLVPPLYLVRAKPHTQALENAIAVCGITRCKQCGFLCGTELSSQYWHPPVNYSAGVDEYCLGCWLDCGPDATSTRHHVLVEPTGDLIVDYNAIFHLGYRLAILPVARLELGSAPICFPNMICFYPPGTIDLEQLLIRSNSEGTLRLAEHSSLASQINEKVLSTHPLVVLPCRFDWDDFCNASHKAHLEFIRSLSEIIDDECFNFIRYRQCHIEPIDILPGRPGQINSNHMMAGALLFDPEKGGQIIGGDAFTHIVTRGLGLPLEPIDCTQFPRFGEVGNFVKHVLSLYSQLIEANSSTTKFVQCLTLLEVLASAEESERFKAFKNTKKNIVRYATNDHNEYKRIMTRMIALTGLKDESGKNIGYRTEIIHFGKRLESLIPSINERENLFRELENYIKCVLDHLIDHSEMSWEDYKVIRDSIGPYGVAPDTSQSSTAPAQQTDDIPF
ncbi:hypothetical protein KIH39_20600 [Telmatocola sphagniphila]|uniref:Uncharacterized protein n=1 Tax=Telmatocola sphagniphila TaxID=1123043 RepID=A0A8E6B4N5_9BACT|nr:hypothetical protein [Telmatocola sphagniphila]QVL31224.1 hypothetical protein KIH39_20600 [Telmatocola sphagniphila]